MPTILNVTMGPWMSSLDGDGRKINFHNAGETDTNAAFANDTSFPGETGIQPLTGASDATQIGAINAAGGGATSSFNATQLNIDANIHLPSNWAAQGDASGVNSFARIGSTAAAANSGYLEFAAANSKVKIYDSNQVLVATGSTALVAGNYYKFQWALDSVGATQALDIYLLSGTTYTLIDSIPATASDFVTGVGATMFAPTFMFATGQPIRVGSVAVGQGGFIAPNGYRVADQRVVGLGNYQDLHATTAWRTKAAAITGAACTSALLSRDCAGAAETDYMECDATVVPKLVSMILTDPGVSGNPDIYWSRFFNCFYNSAAAGGTTARSFVRYNGTDYFCTATGPGVRVAAVGNIPHGRGLRAGSSGWNVTPTWDLLRSAEIGMEYTADGTSNIRWDSGNLMTMYASPPAGSGVSAPKRGSRLIRIYNTDNNTNFGGSVGVMR